MTNADVVHVIGQAAARGIKIADYEATTFLGAKELLEKEPNNANALIAVRTYTQFLETGIKPVSFSEFMLPEFETDEEIAERARRN